MPGLFLPRSRPWLLSTAAERRFEVRSCKPTSRGRPSSVKQLRTIRSRELLVLMAHDCRQSGQNSQFLGYFRIAGHSPGTRTVGIFLFGLVNERIGDDLALIEARRRSRTRNVQRANSILHIAVRLLGLTSNPVAYLSIPKCLRATSAVRFSSAFVDPFAAWMARRLRSEERYLV